MKQTSFFDIGLDYRMAAHTGIGTYLRGLVEGFGLNQKPEHSKLALYKPHGLVGNASFSQMFFDAPIYSIQEQWNYRELLKTCRLWHAPHYNIPYFKGNTKLVTTIHDIIHWKFKHTLNVFQQTYAELMLKRAVLTSDHIMTVSEHTKRDLIECFGASPEKVTVAYNGVSSDFYPMQKNELTTASDLLRRKYGLPQNFFLYVGMIKPHKNILRLLRTFRELKLQNKIECGLVIIGSGAENSEEIKYLRNSQQQIVHIPKTDKGELPIFYNMARALVHPSLYEGFGLTVIEAFACGTPVITTRRASLPEVGGNAARYIDGENETEMKNILCEFDRNLNIKTEFSEKCVRQATQFSWKKAAFETSRIYEKILSE